jgi:hypothetical protein
MNYSRRQLYELGEPFGESATRAKLGGRIYGGGSSQPTDTKQTQVTELPEWAKPYAKDILSKGSALTDVNANPYQAYGGDRIAGFSPLQTQAMTGAQNMQTAPQGQTGTALSTISGLGGLGVANQATTGGFQNEVGGYMNPYLQYSLAPQLAEANRAYDVSGTKQQSAATQAGAFGGSREAIMAAENERNRNMGLQNIVGQGYNTAFNNAQNQYNQNLGTQLQGLGLANSAAGQLGNLGGQQFQQGMDINKLQSGYGAMQQAQQQQGLDVAYQNFQDQRNYPYKQLGYMSDLLRGTPTGSSSVTNMYAPPANVAGQIAGLGIGAMGLSKFMADGGLAGGGQPSVEDPQNIEAIVGKLSDAQLDQALKAAMQRGDAMEIEAIKQEQAMRASERNGLASTVTPQMSEDMMPSAANGGIVAFADNRDQPVSEDMPATEKKPYKTVDDDPTSPSYGRTIGEKRQSTIGKGLEQIGVNDALEAFNRFNINSMKGAAGVEDPETYRAAIEQSPGLFEKLTPKEREQRVKNTKDLYQNSLKKESYKTIDTPEGKADLEAKIRATMGNKVLPQPDTSKVQEQIGANANWGTVPAGSTAGEKKKGLGGALAVGQAVKNVAQNAGVPEQSLEDRAMGIYKKFKEMSSAELKSLNDAIEGHKNDAEGIKAKGLSEALMQFGFGMAANASKPGAKFLGSASGAAPILGQVASENEKLQRAAKDNYMKLKMDQTRYQVALDKGDMQAATSLAAQIRQGDMQQKQLDALVDYHNKSLALEQQKMGVTAAAYAPQSVREAEWLQANKDNPEALKAFRDATRGRDAANIRAQSAGQAALDKSLDKLREKMLPYISALPENSKEYKEAYGKYQNEANKIIQQHRRFYSEPTLGSPDIGGNAAVNSNIKVLN